VHLFPAVLQISRHCEASSQTGCGNPHPILLVQYNQGSERRGRIAASGRALLAMTGGKKALKTADFPQFFKISYNLSKRYAGKMPGG
jgi:hypothetical protein